MRRHAALLTLLVTELGVAALALFFHLHVRPSVLQAFHAFNTALPAATALALTPWFLPGALVVAAVCAAVALVVPLRRSRRPVAAGAGLVVLACALMFAVAAAFVPLFQPD